jgi:hypothetical protein
MDGLDTTHNPWAEWEGPKVDAEQVRLDRARADEKDRQDSLRELDEHEKKMAAQDLAMYGRGPKVYNGNRPADIGGRRNCGGRSSLWTK